MSTPNGINHVAYCTKDMKAQLEFFTDVVGLELKGLFWMHGVEGAMHAFLRLNDDCCFSFVQTADAAEREPVQGLTYPSWGGDAVAWGTLQHIALNVADEAALLAMRDRIRAAVRALPDESRALVEMRYFEELGLAEMEERTGLPRSTLKVRLFRLRKELLGRLGS